jgi:UDP-glucose 4-epimerase
VVYFSSSCAYPVMLAHTGKSLHEDDITWPPGPGMWPDELYGWTKLTGELLAATARDAGVAVSVARPFSVYGPGVADGFAVKGFARQVTARADPIEIWGDDRQVRDFIHVDDVARAVLAIAGQGVDGPVNLGTGVGTSLRDLALAMAGAAGYCPRITVNEGLPAGVMRLVADPGRLNGFCPPQVALDGHVALAAGTA